MRLRILIGALIAVGVAVLIFGLGVQAGARASYPTAWWGGGMTGSYAMGPGMMAGGYGMGPWMLGPGGYTMAPWMFGPYGNSRTPTDLSVDDVKNYFQRSLAFQGNPHVRLGNVTEKDANTITADIVTTDKEGLVQRFAVNRHNGLIQPGEN